MFGEIKEKLIKKVQCKTIQLSKIYNIRFQGNKGRNLSWLTLKRRKIQLCQEKIPIIWMKVILIKILI